MNKPKRSLRSTLAALAASFADAVLVAARESILELAPSQPRTEPRRARTEAARPARPPTRGKRSRPARAASRQASPASAPSPASDLLITDPQALLAAIETATPGTGWEPKIEEAAPREEPEILRPVSATAPASTFAPVLREGEVIVRRSAGGVVLRRRRA